MIKNRNLANEARRRTVQVSPGTVATSAGNNDTYLIAPCTGVLDSVDFSAVDALAAGATNVVTFSLTNLGQAGSGSTVMLHATKNTTDSDITGYRALAANTKYSLYLSTVLTKGQPENLNVTIGDRLLFRIVGAGTLGNTITYPVAVFRFIDKGVS